MEEVSSWLPDKEGTTVMWKGFLKVKGNLSFKEEGGLLMNADRPSHIPSILAIVYPQKLQHLLILNAKALPASLFSESSHHHHAMDLGQVIIYPSRLLQTYPWSLHWF
ncbi:hypothetical protein NC652_023080 [Populus alba x Populus x berolinensis]|uniref:Uncharacterized protein n=2 Tax=Populus alba TaxID=43335 RepID=A0ACC4BQ95_POPAL|nr:hypothetical protein NC652_023080 [Populus alba x Populus x berolinensis]TKR91631.1 hypothetical protein D5086_0000220760 [Populus alba]